MDKIFLVSQIDGNRTFKESEINDFIKEKNGKIKSLSTFGDNLCVVVETPEENKQKETAGDLLLKILTQLPPSVEQNGRSYKLTLVPFGSGIVYTYWDHQDGPTLLNTSEIFTSEVLISSNSVELLQSSPAGLQSQVL